MSLAEGQREGYVPEFNVRTDLALEAREIVQERTAEEMPGVAVEQTREDGVTIHLVKVETREAAQRLGKAPGNYLTLEAPGLRQKDTDLQDRLTDILARELIKFLPLPDKLEESVLIVGLGNWNVTPDALGPKVVGDLLVTRHLKLMKHQAFQEGYRSTCALAPGVLGITGIETSEIVRALVQQVKPSLVIAIDALAAHRLERLHTTIQVADAGVNPGSGVGNNRVGINKETVGVPVVAIGVPTVVEASTIAGDTMDALVQAFKKQSRAPELVIGMEGQSWEERQMLVKSVLEPFVGRLMVTPKEIDTFIDDISLVIAAALNTALHPKVRSSEGGKYLQ
ncbi:MAG: GPR endopeptidase [Dethiobacteria bacterium]|jgi:spore protease|nr:GPR endopeptidase [Bacillota bacterium]HOP68534.1 GPR endopeptidase [Bacillota bacterium]HPT33237.1 GPR endopeptidase [Bacillota bacterium]HQD05630.1 GPR endopeptidase [Bacillota bacterium]